MNKIEINDVVNIYCEIFVSTSNSKRTRWSRKEITFELRYEHFGFIIERNYSYIVSLNEETGCFLEQSEHIPVDEKETMQLCEDYKSRFCFDFKNDIADFIQKITELGKDLLSPNLRIL